MMKRPLFAAALAAATLLAVGAARQGAAADPSVSIGRATFNPTTVRGTGGRVRVNVQITTRGGAQINGPTARAKVRGGSTGPETNLVVGQNGNLNGEVTIPANRDKTQKSVNITIRVPYNGGTATKTFSGAVTLQGFKQDPNAPPPPPDI